MTLIVTACGSQPDPATDVATVQLERVNHSAVTPFTPAVGRDRRNVKPPAKAGGTYAGNTVGLYGGTNDASSCDPAKLVAFLTSHPDKGAAWASVLGIQRQDIPAFVGTLTPVLLRSDTSVTNHGFADGHVTTVQSVLQAGTAVLVDTHGVPVTRCFCGNPLTAPAVFTRAHFVGTRWNGFVATEVTVVQKSTVVVNNFVIVEPSTGDSFTRPAGTTGNEDGPVTSAPPSTGPPTTQPPTTGPPTTQPPTTQRPTTQPAAPPQPPAPPPTQEPTTPEPTTPEPTTPEPTTQPAPTQEAAPTTESPAAPAPPPAQEPEPTTEPVPPPEPVPTTQAEPASAAWVVGDCYADSGTANATVRLRNDGSEQQTFTVTVDLGTAGEATVDLVVEPGETAEETVTAPAAEDTALSCSVRSVVDVNGVDVVQSGTLPPPPDTRPTPPVTPEPSPEPT